jgi:hypothetical protein
MESCGKKCKCVGGACAGLAYDCSNPCDPGFRFDAATCECISEFATSFRVYFTEQQHDTQPCAGIVAEPCDENGACPTTQGSGSRVISPNGTSNLSFYINNFVEYQNYGSTNSWCPANVRPPGQTWADVFGVDKVSYALTAGDASTIETVSYSNSLWAMCTDENGETWAILVDTGWGGSVSSTYRAGGYSNISVEAL